MKLYGSRTSPYVRKARVAMIETGLDHRFEVCDVWAEDSPVPALNPIGKIPVLDAGDGEPPVFDSTAIVDHVDRLSGGRLVPEDTAARRAVMWWHALGHGIIDASLAEVTERRRPQALQSEPHVARERRRTARALAAAEARMRGNGPLHGEALGLGDITLAVALEYVDFRIKIAWRDDHPALAGWLEPMSARASMRDTVPVDG